MGEIIELKFPDAPKKRSRSAPFAMLPLEGKLLKQTAVDQILVAFEGSSPIILPACEIEGCQADDIISLQGKVTQIFDSFGGRIDLSCVAPETMEILRLIRVSISLCEKHYFSVFRGKEKNYKPTVFLSDTNLLDEIGREIPANELAAKQR
jgi:hypothetical protein